jgi:hypothetical protein
MSRQPPLPARRRPIAIKGPTAGVMPPRPTLRLRWSWLLVAALIVLVALATLVVVAHGGAL